jgi:hypothetical protein
MDEKDLGAMTTMPHADKPLRLKLPIYALEAFPVIRRAVEGGEHAFSVLSRRYTFSSWNW